MQVEGISGVGMLAGSWGAARRCCVGAAGGGGPTEPRVGQRVTANKRGSKGSNKQPGNVPNRKMRRTRRR